MFDVRKNHFLQAIIVIGLFWLAILLKAVLVVFFIAFLLTTILHPVVRWLRKKRIPYGFAVMLPVLGLVAIIVLAIYFVAPHVATESDELMKKVPGYIASFKNNVDIPVDISSIRNAVQNHFGTISGVLIFAGKTLLEAIVGIVSIIVITLYWLGSYNQVQRTVLSFVPKDKRERFGDIWARVEKKLVSWIIAQVFLGLVVGILVWIGAMIIGMPFAGILGIIAGVLEIIPTLGPLAAAVPGVLLAMTVSWQAVVAVIIMYTIVQQVENHLLAPVLLGKTIRLSPIIVILSLLVGAVLYGIIGTFLAVPIALVISSVVDSFTEGKPKMKPTAILDSNQS